MTVATYSAVSEIQPGQLARLVSELEALTRRARQIIEPKSASDRHGKQEIHADAWPQITRQMLLDESIEFNFSQFLD